MYLRKRNLVETFSIKRRRGIGVSVPVAASLYRTLCVFVFVILVCMQDLTMLEEYMFTAKTTPKNFGRLDTYKF